MVKVTGFSLLINIHEIVFLRALTVNRNGLKAARNSTSSMF